MSERERVATLLFNEILGAEKWAGCCEFNTGVSTQELEAESERLADAILAALRGDASGTADTSDGIVGRLKAVRHDDDYYHCECLTDALDEAIAHIEALEAKVEEWKQLAELARASMEFTAKVHADAVEENERLRALISTGHDHCPYCEHPIMQGENARLREALESLTDASYQDTCDGSRPCWDVATRALLTDTEDAKP